MKIEEVFALVPSHLPANECWEFQGFLNRDGYGQISDENHRTQRVHRLMYAAHCEPLAKGEIVRHTCDNPACCNPAHLIKGTQLENMRDCITRGRFPDRSGECNGRAKLTEELVADIRKVHSSGMWSYGLLAQLFNVPRSTIINVLKHRTWRACNHEETREKTTQTE